MSKIFYDHLIIIEDLEGVVKSDSHEEREELHQLIDEMIHHRVLGCILDHLPRVHHEEFLEKFHEKPYDESLVNYLQEKTPQDVDIEEKIKEEVAKLKKELLKDLKKK
ncbi:hypothetical protein HYZ78_00575 [Candidatus Microgenomates bacterium]|nr:hypothetical protein [Candidatus Microgenomates bacterium]